MEVEVKCVSSTSGLNCWWISKWRCCLCIQSSEERLRVETPIWEALAWDGLSGQVFGWGKSRFIHPRTPPWDDPKSSSEIFSGRFPDVSVWRSWVTHFFQKRLPARLLSGLTVSATEGRGVVGGEFSTVHLPFLTSPGPRGHFVPQVLASIFCLAPQVGVSMHLEL